MVLRMIKTKTAFRKAKPNQYNEYSQRFDSRTSILFEYMKASYIYPHNNSFIYNFSFSRTRYNTVLNFSVMFYLRRLQASVDTLCCQPVL